MKQQNQSRTKPPSTPSFIMNVINRCEVLKGHGVTPYLVIDGAPLPSKAKTDIQRQADRNECYESAVKMEKAGGHSKLDVKKMYARSVSVTPEVRKILFDRCKGKSSISQSRLVPPSRPPLLLGSSSSSSLFDLPYLLPPHFLFLPSLFPCPLFVLPPPPPSSIPI